MELPEVDLMLCAPVGGTLSTGLKRGDELRPLLSQGGTPISARPIFFHHGTLKHGELRLKSLKR